MILSKEKILALKEELSRTHWKELETFEGAKYSSDVIWDIINNPELKGSDIIVDEIQEFVDKLDFSHMDYNFYDIVHSLRADADTLEYLLKNKKKEE